MTNLVFSTRNIDDLISDIANEVIRKMGGSRYPLSKENDNPKFDADEAAEYLGITKSTLYTKRSRGELPGCKAPGGKKLFFYKSDLDALIQTGRKRTNQEIVDSAHEHLAKRKG